MILLYRMYYCDLCFEDKNKWYYKILKKDAKEFLQPYDNYEQNMIQEDKIYIQQQLEQYCKPSKPPINKKLRDGEELSLSDWQLIHDLDNLINQFSLSEDTVVYRGTDIDIFNKDANYTDKAYVSTSFVKEAVLETHNEKYLYKILLPKETHGFCPQVFTCRNIEYEFILPHNTTFQLLKRKERKEHVEIICKVII